MAAPIASQVLGEVLPYLELNKDNIPEDEKKEVSSVSVPDIRYKTIKEAKKILKEAGLVIELQTEEYNEDENVIISQIPSPGIQVNTGNKVICEVN